MNEQRKQILEMLAAGRITADEAERLIAALERGGNGAGASFPTTRPAPRYLRVIVDKIADEGGDTMTKVNIRVPLQLLRAGVRLAGLIPKEARAHVDEALRERGLAFDLSQLKPENIEELIAQLNDLTVDVDSAHGLVKVSVFCE
jgi:hypothetical protein